MRMALSVLVVCTANVCRSPLAAASMDAVVQFDAPLDLALAVTSAGVDVDTDLVRCAQASEIAVHGVGTGAPMQLSAEALSDAALIVVMERAQRAVVARMAPQCRPRLFTLTQAALLAEYVGRQVVDGALLDGAPALPVMPGERVLWLVSEMDATRGVLAGMGEEVLDIVDVHGDVDHRAALEQLRDTSITLAQWIARVASV